GARARPRQPSTQVVAPALPGLGKGERQQGPPFVVVEVDHIRVPETSTPLDQYVDTPRGESEVDTATTAFAVQQTAVGHPAQCGSHRLLRDPQTGEDVDERARENPDPASQDEASEKGQHQGLGFVTHHLPSPVGPSLCVRFRGLLRHGSPLLFPSVTTLGSLTGRPPPMLCIFLTVVKISHKFVAHQPPTPRKRRSPMDLTGTSAVVTGAGRGLGRAYALELARRGASVVVNDADGDAAEATTTKILENSGVAVAHRAAVGPTATADALTATALHHFCRLDVLVANAGSLRDRVLWKMSDEDFDSVIDVHLRGAFTCARAAATHMRRSGHGGRLIMVASPAGQRGNFGQTNYAAAKAGIAA